MNYPECNILPHHCELFFRMGAGPQVAERSYFSPAAQWPHVSWGLKLSLNQSTKGWFEVIL